MRGLDVVLTNERLGQEDETRQPRERLEYRRILRDTPLLHTPPMLAFHQLHRSLPMKDQHCMSLKV